jgi:hypothetical protein
VSRHCDAFKAVKTTHLIPGSPELFALPSTLYQQLQAASTGGSVDTVATLLDSLRRLIDQAVAATDAEVVLMDTSPFYAGGTHLAWCAADAIILPVRADEASLDALDLTLNLLSDPTKDFQSWNQRAGGRPGPRVAAIVMTMVTPRPHQQPVPDRRSQSCIERALDIATKYRDLFDVEDPADVFVLVDDFLSSGRIRRAKSIPISQLKGGAAHSVDGHRLHVDRSVARPQRELAYLSSVV